MRAILISIFINSILLTTLMVVSWTAASESTDDFYQSFNENNWRKVTDDKLASLRGGFVLPNGIVVDISFEKRVFQNGVMTFSSYFETAENVALIKNGEFNQAAFVYEGILQSVIQNNLDDQTLKTINTINIGIKNLNNTEFYLSNSELYNQFLLPNIGP